VLFLGIPRLVLEGYCIFVVVPNYMLKWLNVKRRMRPFLCFIACFHVKVLDFHVGNVAGCGRQSVSRSGLEGGGIGRVQERGMLE